jgi:DNA modification methylase
VTLVLDKVCTGELYREDNLSTLREFPAESIDLIYLDPPFFSNRFYEVIWGDEAEVRSFEDRWEGGIQHYIGWMQERVVEMHRVLKPTGSLYLHCDPKASHYLKVMLDGVFGFSRFQNEVTWKRFSAKNDAKRYGRSHDVILFYTKDSSFTWHPQYGPFETDYVDENYRYVEEGTGRRYRLSDLTANKPGGDVDYEWRGQQPYKNRHWAFSRDHMDKFMEEGRIVFRRRLASRRGSACRPASRCSGNPATWNRRVHVLHQDHPTPPIEVRDPLHGRSSTTSPRLLLAAMIRSEPACRRMSVQTSCNGTERSGEHRTTPDIEAIPNERLGYPTQKPEALLDPFCGCGTTVVTAAKLRPQVDWDRHFADGNSARPSDVFLLLDLNRLLVTASQRWR